MKKPLILILDRNRERSPLLTQHYNYLARESGPLDIIFSNQVDDSIDKVVWSTCGDRIPDYIYCGFTKVKALRKNKEYVKNNNIKIITEIGDVSSWGIYSGSFPQLKVNSIVFRAPSLYYMGDREWAFKKRCQSFKDAEMIAIPWGIDPKVYHPMGKQIKRSIDFVFLATMISKFAYHNDRRKIMRILTPLKKKYNSVIGQGIFGEEYLKTLCNSRILIVEPSMRNWLTQKYLEGALCGCLMIGKIPTMAQDIFNDGENFVKIEDYNNLPSVIEYYIDHPGEAHKMGRNAMEKVKEKYSIDKTAGKLEEYIMED